MAPRRGDTRERIQEVALALFGERGYNETSMREIAERLGVTKAALYYHFATKEEILGSVVEDMVAAIDDLVARTRATPASPAAREETLRRLVALVRGRGRTLARVAHENRAALRGLGAGVRLRERSRALFSLFDEGATDMPGRLRGRLAVTALLMTALEDPAELGGTECELQEASVALARELLAGGAGTPGVGQGMP